MSNINSKHETDQLNYGADQIQVLEGLEAVRKRPGMYIGSTSREGLHHLITEIVNNSMDEALGGYADHIKVEFFADGSVAIYDNGRGIPFDMKAVYGRTALELAFTELHAGGKFGGGGYKVASGLHGVGASVVNALSSWCRVISRRGDTIVIQEYKNGGKVVRPVEALDVNNPVTKLDGVDFPLDLKSWNYDSGTIVQFLPDMTIFETGEFKKKFFQNQLKEYAYLTAGITFELVDYRDDTQYAYYFESGIKSFLKSLNRNKGLINKNVFHVKKTVDDIDVEVAMQYNDSYSENVLTFANHIKTMEGGTHLTGFRSALTRTVNDYGKKTNLVKDKDGLSGNDLQEGLTAIISVKIESEVLQFEGQTKSKLGNSAVRPAVESVVKEALEIYFEENPKDAQAIITKNVLALRARIAAKAARDTVLRKSVFEGGGVLPGKLADCSSRKAEETELFIVEGDSAGGTAKEGRNREIQAILPLFGKVLNAERAQIDKVTNSDKYKMLITAIGTGVGDQFRIEKLRYGKLIIMADADVDGAHIATLYLTFFYRHMKELVETGHVYMAMPPLYKAIMGKEKKYLFDDAERIEFLKTEKGSKALTQRFKGLGEMNPKELWETTMDPSFRKLKQIRIEDAAQADEVFTMLMGDEVPPRKRFIQTHAKSANVDF